MATDNTPPRLKLIVTIAIITVITLVGINFALTSYYATMTDEARREKLAPTTEKNEQQKVEQTALTNAAIPIDRAMADLAKGARPASITPQPSDDLGPMTGWSKLPKPAPVPQPHAAPPVPTEETSGADAGTSLATDAGARPPTAGDAGSRSAEPNITGDAGVRDHANH